MSFLDLVFALPGLFHQPAEFFYSKRPGFIASVHHRVAVGAQRNHISDRVYFIALANGCQRPDVMDVDEVLAQVSVGFSEIESAALTDGTMMPDTGFPGFSTSFVGIDGNDLSDTFSVLLWHAEFFRISMTESIFIPDTPFLPEVAFFNLMLEIFNRRYVRIIRLRRMQHVEDEELISFVQVCDVGFP